MGTMRIKRHSRRPAGKPGKSTYHWAIPAHEEEQAFVADPLRGDLIREDDAESFAEEFIASVTGGDSVVEDARNEQTIDELGGPFLEIDAATAAAPWYFAAEPVDSEELGPAGE